jgi:hypothetical protein
VDGEDGLTICGPARSNDNFDMFNCYFAYNSSSTPPRMELITKGPMAGGGFTRSLPTMTLPGGRQPTKLLSAGTVFQRRPWPAALLTVLSPGSAPLDDPVLRLPHVCPCPTKEDAVSNFLLAQCSYSLFDICSLPPSNRPTYPPYTYTP